MAREALEKDYDVVIIGGGIVGAGILRDLSLHNINTLLLEREDFSSQTSQGSSKMLHGGIRYLENLDFALVFEALREKNLWLKLAPHITREASFHLPVYKDSKWPLLFMRAGLFLYDLLSLFKNSPHKVFNKKETLREIPGLKEEGLTGAGMYFDGIVDDSKLAIDCILDALTNPNVQARNYAQVVEIKGTSAPYKITVKDKISNTEETVTAKHIVFATGPFTDQVMLDLAIPWQPVVLPSKGVHLWLEENSLQIKSPMVLQTKDQRIIFVIPQRRSILVGTTEDVLKESEEMINIKPTQAEIDYLINCVNEYFPQANITDKNVINSFAAIRPLVRAKGSSSKTSRHHKIYTPQKNMQVIVGGKYTTFRVMAQDISKTIVKSFGGKYNKNASLTPFKKTTSIQNPFNTKITEEKIRDIIESEFVFSSDDLISRRLSLPSIDLLADDSLKEVITKLEKDFPQQK